VSCVKIEVPILRHQVRGIEVQCGALDWNKDPATTQWEENHRIASNRKVAWFLGATDYLESHIHLGQGMVGNMIEAVVVFFLL
jgi:hypothetical protein